MFKSYESVSRFMDGLAINYGAEFIYLKDISGGVRIGKPHFNTRRDETPTLGVSDVISRRTMLFEGDTLKLSQGSPFQFVWFPSVADVGVLYDGFDNDIQRHSDMLTTYRNFLHSELVFQAARNRGELLGDETRSRLDREFEPAVFLYANSLQLLYAAINRNRDYLMIRYRPTGVTGTEFPFLDVGGVNLDGSLDGFLRINPEFAAYLGDCQVSRSGVKFDSPEKVMEELRKHIPDELLEEGYQQFISEMEARRRLDAIRSEHPREELEVQVQEVDTEQPHVVSLGFAREDLERFNS